MSRGAGRGTPPFEPPNGPDDGLLSREEFESLIDEAAGEPDRISSLVRELVLQTIAEVRADLGRDTPKT